MTTLTFDTLEYDAYTANRKAQHETRLREGRMAKLKVIAIAPVPLPAWDADGFTVDPMTVARRNEREGKPGRHCSRHPLAQALFAPCLALAAAVGGALSGLRSILRREEAQAVPVATPPSPVASLATVVDGIFKQAADELFGPGAGKRVEEERAEEQRREEQREQLREQRRQEQQQRQEREERRQLREARRQRLHNMLGTVRAVFYTVAVVTTTLTLMAVAVRVVLYVWAVR